MTKPILVTGATGQQGGAVAAELLRRGTPVHALVRNPDSPAATALARAGAVLVPGDLDDPASLRAAMAPVDKVFSVQTFAGPDGLEGEVRQGKAVVDAAARTGITHLVYSSVDGSERNSGVPHFESKWEVERYLSGQDVPATVLRPVFFMENLTGPAGPRDGVLRQAIPPEVPLQLVATADIGLVAAEVFADSGNQLGRAIGIAGDELTGPQLAQVFTDVTGTRTEFAEQPVDEIARFSPDLAAMYRWFGTAGYQVDIPALRRRFPGLRTTAEWLRTTIADD